MTAADQIAADLRDAFRRIELPGGDPRVAEARHKILYAYQANDFDAALSRALAAIVALDDAEAAAAAEVRAAQARMATVTEAGANLFRAKINDKTVIGILRRATRSDGHEFFLWHCREGYFLKAGCCFLDMEAARQHWTTTRQGTAIGNESLDILDFFDAAIKRQEAAQ